MVGSIASPKAKYSPEKDRCRIPLQPTAESVVRIPVGPGSPEVGVVSKCEIQEGVSMTAALTTMVDGYVLTSILNVN
jgi:hypothetical protein